MKIYILVILLFISGCACQTVAKQESKAAYNPDEWFTAQTKFGWNNCNFYTQQFRADLLRECRVKDGFFFCPKLTAEKNCRTYSQEDTHNTVITYACQNTPCNVIETHRISVQ